MITNEMKNVFNQFWNALCKQRDLWRKSSNDNNNQRSFRDGSISADLITVDNNKYMRC